MENKRFTSIGYLTKEEKLSNINFNIIPGTCVVENLEPFPGYHGSNLPSETIPDSVFFLTKEEIAPDQIIRISQKVKKYFTRKDFNSAPAWIKLYSKNYSAIRVLNIEKYELIKDLQTCFFDEGIEFRKFKKFDGPALIKVQKFYNLQNVDEEIFLDNLNIDMAYIKLPTYINWKLFEKITEQVKNNIENRNFDAAWATIYCETEMLDLVRIYKKGVTTDVLQMIKEKYYDVIRQFSK